MPKPTKWPSTGWQNTDTPFAAHVQIAGVDITQSGISAASYTVISSSGAVLANAVALTVSAVVFNALQTDARWTADNTGYNLLFTVPATYFPSAGDYTVRCDLTPSGGNPFPAAYFKHHANSRT